MHSSDNISRLSTLTGEGSGNSQVLHYDFGNYPSSWTIGTTLPASTSGTPNQFQSTFDVQNTLNTVWFDSSLPLENFRGEFAPFTEPFEIAGQSDCHEVLFHDLSFFERQSSEDLLGSMLAGNDEPLKSPSAISAAGALEIGLETEQEVDGINSSSQTESAASKSQTITQPSISDLNTTFPLPPSRPFACTIPFCNRSYTRIHELRRHTRAHIGARPYACRFVHCPRSGRNGFERKDHMRQHLRQVHKVSA